MLAGLLAYPTFRTFPSSDDSGKYLKASARTYSCGYSSGIKPDSLSTHTGLPSRRKGIQKKEKKGYFKAFSPGIVYKKRVANATLIYLSKNLV